MPGRRINQIRVNRLGSCTIHSRSVEYIDSGQESRNICMYTQCFLNYSMRTEFGNIILRRCHSSSHFEEMSYMEISFLSHFLNHVLKVWKASNCMVYTCIFITLKCTSYFNLRKTCWMKCVETHACKWSFMRNPGSNTEELVQ